MCGIIALCPVFFKFDEQVSRKENVMSPNELLSLEDIKAVFTEEIEAAGGTVSDVFEGKAQLFARSILPRVGEVTTQDQIKPGVALRAVDQEVSVYPYIFRLVCTNGAILAHALDAQQIWLADIPTTVEMEISLRSMVRACCSDGWFVDATQQLGRAQQTPVDALLGLMPHLSRMPRPAARRFMDSIMREWTKNADHSRYGLMNAVTATARDTVEAELRWQLEAIGGQIGIAEPVRLARLHSAELTEELAHL
jgi:hypothetical protein